MKMQVAGFGKFLGVVFVLMAGMTLRAADAYEEVEVAYGEREFRLGPGEAVLAQEEVVAYGEREFWLGPAEGIVVAFDERYFYLGPVRIAGSFVIHFLANGGTGTMSDQTCERGKVYQLAKNKFSKTGTTTFKGWKCSNGKRYDDQILIFDLAESGKTVTMTAVWE